MNTYLTRTKKPLLILAMAFISFYSAQSNSEETVNLSAFEACPYVCTGEDNDGVLISLVREILKDEAYKLRIHILPYPRALKMTKNGAFDGIIGIQQKWHFNFIYPTKSIGRYQYNFYTSSSSTWNYTGLNSLYTQRIGIEKGLSYGIFDSFIKRYADSANQLQFIHGHNILNRKLELLRLNRIDAFVADKNALDWYVRNNKNNELREAGSFPMDDIFIGFHASEKGQRLADIVSKRINELRSNGQLAQLLQKFGLSDWENWSIGDESIFENNYLDNLSKNSKQAIQKLSHHKIKFKAAVSEDSGYWHYAIKFKEIVEAQSKGKIRIELEFKDVSEHDIVYDLVENKAGMGIIAINNYTPFAPSAGVFALPYMFPTIEAAKNLIQSKKLHDITQKAALESGLRPLSFFIGGYRTLLNNKKPVLSTSDLTGLKIRVPRNQLMVEAFRAWGVEPYPTPWDHVYPALLRGDIDGMDNPLNIANAAQNKTHEIWHYYTHATDLKYFLFIAPHLISEQLFLSLNEQAREIIQQAALEAQAFSWQKIQTQENNLIKLAQQNGIIFNSPKNERNDWEAKAKSTWPKMYFRVGGKTHVEETLKATLGTHSQQQKNNTTSQ